MKKQYLLFIFLSFSSSQSTPPLEQLKPFFESAQNGDHDARALCEGVIAVHTSELKNRLLFDQNHHEHTLLSKLFHVNVGGEFLTTRHKPWDHFTPKSIAWLVQWREQNYGITEVASGKEKPLITTLRSATFSNDHKKRLRETMLSITNPQNKIWHKALMAFLYLRAASFEELMTYFSELAILRKQQSINYPLTVWSATDHEQYQKWAQDCTKKNENDETVQEYAQKNMPNIAYSKLLERQFLPGLLPKLFYGDVKLNAQTKTVRDCCETVLQEFVNRLLYRNQKFDIDCGVPLNVACKQFYAQFAQATTVAQVNNDQRRHAWMQLVSNIVGAEYRKTSDNLQYEIHPSVKNFVCILNYLFGTTSSDISQLCATISKPNVVNIEYDSQKTTIRSDTNADLVFDLNMYDGQQRQFTIHIRTDHAWITDQYQLRISKPFDNDLVTNEQRLVSVLRSYLARSYGFDYGINAFAHHERPIALSESRANVERRGSSRMGAIGLLAPLFAHGCSLKTSTDIEEQKRLLFSYPSETELQKYCLLRRVLECTQQNPTLSTSFGAVIEKLDHPEFIKNAIMRCIEKNQHLEPVVKKIILEKVPRLKPEYKQQILLALAEKGFMFDADYCTLVQELLHEIPDGETTDNQIVTVDTKVITLARWLQTDLVNNRVLLDAVAKQIKSLNSERQEKLKILVQSFSI